jgi:hypothetical protein
MQAHYLDRVQYSVSTFGALALTILFVLASSTFVPGVA